MTPFPALAGRRVVLGVTGGIAAYKAVELCRRLVEAGAIVSPVMTDDATRFVGEVTLSALASEPVRRSLWDGPEPIPHTRLGQGADAVVVAPATARFIAAYAHGMSDDLLTATVLATRAPVVVCPAMHSEMWDHPAVQDNLELLRRRGVVIVPPAQGVLAGGDVGTGRLAETQDILVALHDVLTGSDVTGAASGGGVTGGAAGRDLQGRCVLVTAGGTREAIDPVRFITNRSSGKQGHALAEVAARRGASVVLVTTTALPVSAGIEVVRVNSAAEMESAVLQHAEIADVVVMAAAVADFRPKAPSTVKLSKSDGVPDLVLEPTPDILSELGRRRPAGQVLVGFAAETHDVGARARAKLQAKDVDFVVANNVAAPGSGFDHDTNAVTILGMDGSSHEVGLRSKEAVAHAVLDTVAARLAGGSPSAQDADKDNTDRSKR
ncbi:MAG TPA: bifunctional phosphopantothenoylcysteine decarboxylase/phosphopantothenate--cysteine ligase CoaBC [Acidimicrobiales bacterium]|nr:bifunctional phosphopantothenoylcysteine decarboxylase/phosphopantothenate--cysteine ligase CoaBC [Acidimicrobiales bacterium]